jgi:hypothetical protein
MSGTARSTGSTGSTVSPSRPAWVVLAASVAVAVAIWMVAAPLAGAALLVDSLVGRMEVDLPSVVLGSVIGGLGALAVGRIVRRLSSSPRRHFLVATGVILALSLIGPATTALSTTTAIWLCCMHLAVGAVAIPLAAGRLPE